jgi:maltose alpha-D-glucosyltransferase / alpha-amylase
VTEAGPWFKTAVFYEIHVRGFFDGNDDGTGDLRGLKQRLEYLVFLGVDCLVLHPIYPSPLRHAGYDVADLEDVHAAYGTVRDLRDAVETAHEEGLRVVLDLVLDHTSSEHPWFEDSRNNPEGARGDWYVWTDTEGEDGAVRWTLDAARGQYYRHRLSPDLPDLDLGDDGVQEALLGVARFWLELGVDGFRLNSVGPEAHGFLKRLRAELDRQDGDRVLAVQACEWPDRAAAYFGDADECHLATHFPLMQRMFMALRREDARPLYEILEQTPPGGDTHGWSFVLRIHDELTLEPVTDEGRDYLWGEYEKDPRMKRNLGTRRRLAPLLENDREDIKLMHAILFSLPGSPVIYYGDEIGMGDNPSIGPSEGVHTPMQWTGDRNGGFSRADFAQLYLQPLMDPVYGYQAVNVEAQLRTPTSLLSWLRRFIELRKEHPIFGCGSYEPLGSDNPRVFAHIRRWQDQVVVWVSNLATSAQPVQLDLSAFRGMVPEEVFGPTDFPPIGDLPYLLTLKPRGFFCFRLKAA